MSKIQCDDPAHHIAFTEYRLAAHVRTECTERIAIALRQEVQTWRSLPVIKALMTLRGVDFLSAATIVAELGDLRRFAHPKDLMGYLGLVPSEHSSGPKQHRGELTRTGNTHVRRILIAAAWNYRFPARIGESLQPRIEGQPQPIVAIAWKAQLRLCARFRRLRARGVHHNKVTAAIARELCGFIWSIGRQVRPNGSG